MRALAVLSLVPLTFACDTRSPDGPGDACDGRRGGALTTFEADSGDTEPFTVWITAPAFIEEAKQLALVGGGNRIACFRVVADPGCDARWNFSVDAVEANFTDVTVEIYDAAPSWVNENLATWLDPQMRWCPWSHRVVEVDDQR